MSMRQTTQAVSSSLGLGVLTALQISTSSLFQNVYIGQCPLTQHQASVPVQKINFYKLEMSALRRYRKFYGLVSLHTTLMMVERSGCLFGLHRLFSNPHVCPQPDMGPNATKDELVAAVYKHFATQVSKPVTSASG